MSPDDRLGKETEFSWKSTLGWGSFVESTESFDRGRSLHRKAILFAASTFTGSVPLSLFFFFFFTSDKWISVYSKPELNSKRQRDELKLEGKGNFSSFRVSKKLCFFLPELIVFIRAPAIFSRATYTGRGARFVVSSFHRSRSKSRLPSSRGR